MGTDSGDANMGAGDLKSALGELGYNDDENGDVELLGTGWWANQYVDAIDNG